jgi:prolyl-tRNA synthetase
MGVNAFLPMATRSMSKIEGIVRAEMDRIGAQEFRLPSLYPEALLRQFGSWKETRTYSILFKDHSEAVPSFGISPAAIFTILARDELRSHRDLSQIWYQIQVRVQDTTRPKAGLLKVKESRITESLSLALDQKGLDRNYSAHQNACRRILGRCGLPFCSAQSSVTDEESERVVVFAGAGDRWIVDCPACSYSADLDCARSALERLDDSTEKAVPSEVHTPNQKTIQEVSEFLNVPESRQIKSLVYLVESQLHMILLRGDHQLSEARLARALATENFRPGSADEIREAFQADPGSLGPVGLADVPILADMVLKNRRNMICGANKNDFHLINVSPGVHFSARYEDLREVQQGDPCPRCNSPLDIRKALEIGRLSKLGIKVSETMKATVLAQDGLQVPAWMGSFQVDIERILAATAETHNDELGLVWPRAIAPFQVVVTLLRPDDPDQRKYAELYLRELEGQGVDCLLDDRDLRPGVKFKDAELIGFPLRITLGRKLAQSEVEIFQRNSRESCTVSVESAIKTVLRKLDDYPV